MWDVDDEYLDDSSNYNNNYDQFAEGDWSNSMEQQWNEDKLKRQRDNQNQRPFPGLPILDFFFWLIGEDNIDDWDK